MIKHRYPALTAVGNALCSEALDQFIEPARRVARDAGYALCIHGSLARDIDLVAVPWTERAECPDRLADRLAATIASIFGRCNRRGGDWTEKPHGRRATTLLLWLHDIGSIDIDLSVMPRMTTADEQ